jgi:hypothetical protein
MAAACKTVSGPKTLSMISAPVVITGRSSRRYTTSVVRVEACPARRAISSVLTPRWLMTLTNEVRSSRGIQPSPVPAAVHTRLNIFRMFPPSSAAPRWEVKTSPVSCHRPPARARSRSWLACRARSASTASFGRARVRRDRPVLVSPRARTDRHTAT